ncbi:GGDEF domain-containing response regulator [Thiohalophilus thiocyanatoxydans]|uniref:Response regulator receiver modulated diguanylate cyclase n=1 Tax=Thiohalophilus thiocyanatoxydans TaxID=381308 RepID=A0A4R8IUR4_9GAMM|nr:diguanylate cyclase [Thiohalophilus thiocyanatoxydans]TDY01053.1 response regulator receiver modulated diguanylate cyclase [Thiohalophilus thiocyanatoxydans]
MADDNNNSPRILVVDDSRVMRKAMTKVLGTAYHVIEADHGEDAWTYLTNDPEIQVVFTDLSMPYLDGFGLLERMRSADDPHLRELPAIIITGKEDDDQTKQLALDKGASDFITKPFDSVQLQARAKAHVNFKQTTHKLTETTDKLEQQTAVDQVTGLGGQTYFCRAADECLAYFKRHGGQFTLLRMDIDNFNSLFISNGKALMDQILQKISATLTPLVRKEDMLARVGLAKFAMLLRDTSTEDASLLAERMRSEINALSFNSGEQQLHITVSIGLLEPHLTEQSDIKTLVAETETYLNKAMEAGGNQVVAHSQRKDSGAAHLDIEQALKLIEEGKQDLLKPHLGSLMQQLLPLLNYISQQSSEDMAQAIEALKEKLEA